MKKVIATLFCAMTLSMAACGGADNVGACKRFLTAAKCGSTDISTSFNCDVYANTTCDIASYFDCAASHYVCTNGQYDSAKLQTFASDCASKATCK